MTDQPHDLESMIARVEKLIDRLPVIPGTDAHWDDFSAAHRARRPALENIINELRSHGARVHITATDSRISLLGVKTTSTAGGVPLLRNWVTAAHRHQKQVAEAQLNAIEQLRAQTLSKPNCSFLIGDSVFCRRSLYDHEFRARVIGRTF